ncbi:MAG: hypothetical protein RLP44_01795 [Aggregatilineales bacterium]
MKNTVRLLLIVVLVALAVSVTLMAQDDNDEMILDSLVNIGENAEFSYLVGPEGMTLYTFSMDDALCVDDCLEAWMPLTVDNESELTKTAGIPGNLGIYEREGDINQVTYNAMPLYYFSGDEQVGDINGDRVGNVWFIVEPKNLYVGGNGELGKFLVGPEGMTLYVSTNDQPDVSNCTAGCLENWIPFTVETDAELTRARNVPGQVGLIERPDDGTLQVTYNSQPLYYFSADENVGDSNGQGFESTWYIFPPETVFLGGTDAAGAWLETAYRRTLYASQLDDSGASNCLDECAEMFIPYTVNRGDVVYGLRLEGEISLITRPDDTLQVAYNEMPLYTYVGDTMQGELNGYGIDEVWFNVPPAITRDQFMNLSTDPFGGDDEGDDDEGGDS